MYSKLPLLELYEMYDNEKSRDQYKLYECYI